MKNLLYILIEIDPCDPTTRNIHFIADSEKKCQKRAEVLYKDWTGKKAKWQDLKIQSTFNIQDIDKTAQTSIKYLTDEICEELNALERKIVSQYFDKNDINFLDLAETFLEKKDRNRYFKLRKLEDPELEI